MTTAVAGARFVAVTATRADSPNWSRNSGFLNMASPMVASPSVSFDFFSSRRTAMNAALIARASDLDQGAFGEVSTEEAPAAAAAPADADADADPTPIPLPASPAPVQLGSKLYVGNLPWSCDSTQLAEICQDVGEVEAVEVIYDQENGRSRGFAFVTMASNADAQAVINALDGADLGGRALRVNYPQSNKDRPRFERSERSAPIGGGYRRPDDPNKLFVGNLAWGCDEGALHQLFSDYGKVVEAKVVYDSQTGRSRGFGFVTFENETEVNRAIENLDGADLEGRQLRVNLAGDKPPARF